MLEDLDMSELEREYGESLARILQASRIGIKDSHCKQKQACSGFTRRKRNLKTETLGLGLRFRV